MKVLPPYANDLRLERLFDVPPRVWVLWAKTKARPRSPEFAPHIVVPVSAFRPGLYDWSDVADVPVTVLVGTRSDDAALWRLVAELAAVTAPVDVVLGLAGAEDWPTPPGELLVLDAGEALMSLRVPQAVIDRAAEQRFARSLVADETAFEQWRLRQEGMPWLREWERLQKVAAAPDVTWTPRWPAGWDDNLDALYWARRTGTAEQRAA